jgi:hypothetical protein
MGSGIFLPARLDAPNRIESFKEITLQAQTIFSERDAENDVIPGRCHRVLAMRGPMTGSRIEPGISRFRVWCLRTIPE